MQSNFALEPEADEREQNLSAVLNYAENFITALPAQKGYSKQETTNTNQFKINESGKGIESILHLLKDQVDSRGINTASGRHMGFIPGGGLWASALGDFLAAITNRYSGIAFSNPGAVAIEHELIQWMIKIVGFPATAYGNLTSGGSTANLIGVKTARDIKGINASNVNKAVLYLTEHTHHCIFKSLQALGLHEAIVRNISLDDKYRMNTLNLKEKIEGDINEGLLPFLVVASLGTTDTGAVDEINGIAEICETNKLWLHTDGAYGGFFVTSSSSHILKGIERSDSIVLDPHKTLFLPYGSGAVLIKDKELLLKSNSSKANYMKDSYGINFINPADTGIELTRHNRAMRMWLPLQLYGSRVFSEVLNEKLELTKYFYESIIAMGFEILIEPQLTVTVFRLPESNSANQKFIDAVHDNGTVFMSSTEINGKLWLRCAIVSHRTHKHEVDLALEMLNNCKLKK